MTAPEAVEGDFDDGFRPGRQRPGAPGRAPAARPARPERPATPSRRRPRESFGTAIGEEAGPRNEPSGDGM
ncbi:hypothetical protein GCM10020229_62790 [Kitasatospora albolonga]